MRGPPTSNEDEKPRVWGFVPPGSEGLGGAVDFSDYVWMGEEMEEFDNKVTTNNFFTYDTVLEFKIT